MKRRSVLKGLAAIFAGAGAVAMGKPKAKIVPNPAMGLVTGSAKISKHKPHKHPGRFGDTDGCAASTQFSIPEPPLSARLHYHRIQRCNPTGEHRVACTCAGFWHRCTLWYDTPGNQYFEEAAGSTRRAR